MSEDKIRMDRILKSIETIFERKHEQLYSHAFDLWSEIYKSDNFKLEQEHKAFIFNHLLPTVVSQDANIQSAGIRAAKLTIPLLLNSDYRGLPEYKKFLSNVITEYMPHLKVQLESINDWAHIWCLFLLICQKDVAKSIQVNAFLAVAESGFRSPQIANRTKSFVCWRKLIEVFGNEGQLLYPKKIKLIIMPLTATPSKTQELASAKFDCWAYLMNHISTELCEDPLLCFTPFLQFCFGPIGDSPLVSYKQNMPATYPGKLYVELRLPVVLVLINLLGRSNDITSNLLRDRNMSDSKPVLDIAKAYTYCRMEIVYSCAEATMLIYAAHNLSPTIQAGLTKNLWTNLFNLLDSDEQILKSMVLVVESVKALVRVSPSLSTNHLAAIPIIVRCLISPTTNPNRPLEIIIEYSASLVRLLIGCKNLLPDKVLDESFKVILSFYQKIVLPTNKVVFGSRLCKEVIKIPGCLNDFKIWLWVWKKFVAHMDDVPMDYLNYGLQEFFEEMLVQKRAWLVNGKFSPRNRYLSSVALIFNTVCANKAASLNVVDAVVFIMENVCHNDPNPLDGVLKLFTDQFKRFLFTEFVVSFLEALHKFLTYMTPERMTAMQLGLSDTVDVLKSYDHLTANCEIVEKIRSVLQVKCLVFINEKNRRNIQLLEKHKQWIFSTKSPKSTAPPPKVEMKPPAVAPAVPQPNGDCVPIKRVWSFNPKELTDHQIERMKQRRDDIPAMYNDDSQSQDSRSLKPWIPATITLINVPSSTPAKGNVQIAPKPSIVPEAPKDSAAPSMLQITPVVETPPKSSAVVAESPKEKAPITPKATKPDSTATAATKTSAKKTGRKSNAAELSRLTIDTVEGNPFGKLEDGSRRRRTSVINAKNAANLEGKENTDSGLSPTKKKDDKEKKPTKQTPKTVKTEQMPTRKRRATASTSKTKLDADGSLSENVSDSDTPSFTIEKEHLKKPKNPAPPLVAEKSPVKMDTADKPMVTIPGEIASPEKVVADVEISMGILEEVKQEVIETEPMNVPLPELVEPVVTTTTAVDVPTSSSSVERIVVPEDPIGMEEDEDLILDATTGILSTSAQRSIVSSPELENVEQRESTFLNDTVNISPILKEVLLSKGSPPKINGGVSGISSSTIITVEPKTPEILTTPKRNMDSMVIKETSTAVATTPHPLFLSKMNGRGAQMLQQTKLFQESTPKERTKEEIVQSKEEALQRLLIRSANPSCKSSPSTSILRRKRLEDSMDETMESPAAKKKKVSFSDPPVSATKEYERDVDSKKNLRPLLFKSKLNRLLIRKSRQDSASEIRELRINENGVGAGYQSDSDSDMECAANEVAVKEEMEMDDSKIFEYLQKKYAGSGDQSDAPKLAVSQSRILTKILLQNVANNEPTRDIFFHALMYAMPKEALKWALQENSGYTNLTAVTEQVSSATFNNFVISKLKSDEEFAQQMCKDMQLRMDAMQKLKFIRMLSSDPGDSST